MIVVTGAAGFIASCLVGRLNQDNFNDIVVVDNFSVAKKEDNLKGKHIKEYVDRENFFEWLDEHYEEVEFIFHLGARTDTTEFNKDVFDLLNLNYSKQMWNACAEYQIPLVYASSAATYGSGTLGYDDNEEIIPLLKPLNPYGDSKNDFDIWALQQTAKPFFWAGLKFFNVYGPNEYHKGKMASVIFHAYNQIKERGSMKLFRSHNPEYADGEQMRDFVYVKDVVDVCMFLMHHRKNSGIYNLGSGKARTFMALALNTFEAMGVEANIEFMDTPENLRDNYQYFTEANMQKLRSIGYDKPFYTLEEGVKDYVQNYLMEGKYY
ncbi:ADP-glyceromanno-heptose 6-epimerase [Pontibacter chinhatensis]|uniref:ADP-L-glycero-D-manno-heptose-6-epimerase n=1 Tax=Pontibacter chinhatensis TaxID=1436961 RepID=A0A1I2YFZ0_9BACT|nr:ADP-glyceromanno-heptose 6-epimerase [Pontibacter chinhatensis]SFH23461.1 ADP-glyceromanno-heptose 6-epimerase precursor [Pontibacter chinhatensis]